jgi:hypothetical protein
MVAQLGKEILAKISANAVIANNFAIRFSTKIQFTLAMLFLPSTMVLVFFE